MSALVAPFIRREAIVSATATSLDPCRDIRVTELRFVTKNCSHFRGRGGPHFGKNILRVDAHANEVTIDRNVDVVVELGRGVVRGIDLVEAQVRIGRQDVPLPAAHEDQWTC